MPMLLKGSEFTRAILRWRPWAGWAVVVVALGALLVSMGVAVWMRHVSQDGGYYLSLARHVARGDVPYVDFPCFHPPGASYLWALLGMPRVSDPRWGRALMFLAHLGSWALLYGWCHRVAGARLPAALATVGAAVWIMSADGDAILLEPFQNFFILAGVTVAGKARGAGGALTAGLLLGAALMVKQYAILAIPGVWLLMGQVHGWRPTPGGLFVFGVGLAGPWLVFVGATQATAAESLRALATFGGQAADYPKATPMEALSLMRSGPIAWRVLPWVLIAVLAGSLRGLSRGDSGAAPCAPASALRLPLVTTGTALLFALPLLIRHHGHYLQLAAPWAAVSLLAWQRRHAARPTARDRAWRLALAACAIAVTIALPVTISKITRKHHRDRQLEFVERALPHIGASPVLVLNAAWLYLLADIEPPRRNYLYVQGPEGAARLRAEARSAVMMETAGAGFPAADAHHWLQEGGFRSDASLIYGSGRVVRFYHRPAADAPPRASEPP